jgi:hypothetical protein
MLGLKIHNLKATIVQQQQQIDTLIAGLKEQAAEIEKANARLEMNKPVAKVVVNKP